MTPERAEEILTRTEKQRARKSVTQAFEAVIDELGVRYLFDDHVVTRRKNGWVWRETRKAQKHASCQETWIE